MATSDRTKATAELFRQSLRLGISALITCTIAMHFARTTYIWYSLLAVILVINDHDENSIEAARGRILGTIAGGLVSFAVHTIISGWIGVMLSLIIIVPLLRRLGWSSGLSTACVITVIFIAVPVYSKLNWYYVFQRSLDTLIGIAVALLVGRMLWPKNRIAKMKELVGELQVQLDQRLLLLSQWLAGEATTPTALDSSSHTRNLLELQRLINVEIALGGRNQQRLRKQRWPQRMLFWRSLQVRLIQVDRLLEKISRTNNLVPQQALSRYLIDSSDQGWESLELGPDGERIPTPWRHALVEEVTRLCWLIRSQKRFECNQKR